MTENKYRLKIDIKRRFSSEIPTFVQYDDARLEFELLDLGVAMDLTGVERVEFVHKRPDGVVLVGDGTIEGNIVAYDYLGSEMAVPGTVMTSFSMFDTDGTKVSVQPFTVTIVSDLRDLAVSPTNPEYGALQTLIAEVEVATTNANEAATYANEQGALVSTAITDANTAVTEANTAVTAANEAVTTANAAASTATTAAENVTGAVDSANLAASEATTAAGLANDATTLANTAASNADLATSNANTAASTATTAATNADIASANVQDVIDTFGYVAPWSNTSTYEKNNIVSFNGSSFISKVDGNIANIPVEGATTPEWGLLAQRGVDGEGSVSTVNGILPDINGNVELGELGGGAVDSVNGQTGVVVLTATDVGASATGHGHAISEVTGLQAGLDGKSDVAHAHDWAEVTGKPTEFTPTAHNHAILEVTGLQAELDGKADDLHAHAIADVTGLQAGLDAKADDIHTHAIADVTGLQAGLDGKADDVHTHLWADVTDKPLEFAPTAHLHEIADVNGLQTALDDASSGSGGGTITYAVDSDYADDFYSVSIPGVTEYTEGMSLRVRVNAPNDGSASLNINGMGGKPIFKYSPNFSMLQTGDVLISSVMDLVYEGANFILLNPSNDGKSGGTATQTTITDAGGYYTSGHTEGALQEIGQTINAVRGSMYTSATTLLNA